MALSFRTHFKGISRDSLVYGAADAVSKLISIFTAPIMTRIFAPSDYGVISLLQFSIGLLVMLAGMNLNSGTYYFYNKVKNQNEKEKVLSSAFFVYISLAIIMSTFTWFFAGEIESFLLINADQSNTSNNYEYEGYIKILAIGIFFGMIDSNSRSLLRMQRKPVPFMLLSMLQLLLSVGLVIYMVVFLRLGLYGAIWAGVISTIIVSIVGFTLVYKNYKLVFSSTVIYMILAYALPQFPGVLVNWSLYQSNKIFLNYYSTLEQQGLLAIATQVAAIVLMIITAFRTAYDPIALSIMHDQNKNDVYSKFYTTYILLIGLLAAGVAVWARPVLQLLTPSEYHSSYSIVGILTLGYLYMGANNILGTGIWLSERTKYISYAQIIAFAVNTLLNIVLIPMWWAWGAAIAFLAGAVAQSIAYYVFAQRLHHIPYQYWRLQLFLVQLYGIVFVYLELIKDADFLEGLLFAMVMSAMLLLFTWRLGLRDNERHKTKELIMKRLGWANTNI